MTNEYLTFKNLVIANAAILLLYGIGFILIPEDTLDFYDVSLTNDGEFVTKLWGATYISLAIIVWAIRDMEFSDNLS